MIKNEALLETAANSFNDSKVNITTEGKSIQVQQLAVMNSEQNMLTKVNEWCEELKTSSNFVKSLLQAVYFHKQDFIFSRIMR